MQDEQNTSLIYKVGDTARITGNRSRHGFLIGLHVRIISVGTQDYQAEPVEGGRFWWVEPRDLGPSAPAVPEINKLAILREALERIMAEQRRPNETEISYQYNRCWHIADEALKATKDHQTNAAA